jgi:hypothetical protein
MIENHSNARESVPLITLTKKVQVEVRWQFDADGYVRAARPPDEFPDSDTFAEDTTQQIVVNV